MLNRIRNIRKRWIVISAIGALLAIGLVSGAVLAADARDDLADSVLYDGYRHGPGGKGNSDALLLRVADILGIEQATLASAFLTARSEETDARFTSYTGLLVAGGTLTQEQADEADTWFSERPEGLDWASESLARSPQSDQFTARLTRLVTSGTLTQEQAESIASWHADRPDFLPEAATRRDDRGWGKRGGVGERYGHH